MNRRFLVAASAVVIFITATVTAASAHDGFSFNLNLGGEYPGYYYADPYPVYPRYPGADDGYDSYDDSSCGYEYITVKKWNRYHDRYRIVHKRVWVCN